MTAIYTDERCLAHFAPQHPESPDRQRAAVAALRKYPGHRWPSVSPADPSFVAAIHGDSHVRTIERIATSGGGWVDPDTFVGPESYTAALCAAGAALQAAGDVLAGHEPNAFVVVRPPGHHATIGRPMGFCLFNNVAAAARWTLAEGGARRAAILDIDVHHGNGTQDIFYDRADVLYYSTHQYPYYPGTGELADTGRGDGVGATINVPLGAGCGDSIFLEITDRVLDPALRRFAPDIILVSLGFDAHWADPLAQMRLSLDGYAAILQRVQQLAKDLCDGRLVCVLEGGYNLRVVADGAAMVGAVLSGEPAAADAIGGPPGEGATPTIAPLVDRLCRIHDLPAS